MLHFHNTENNRKEPFKPLVEGKAGLYTCGPTVYDYAHIGNFRAYLFEDVLRRYLEFRGYEVNHVMNLTDVEDKIIRRARETGKTIYECTAPYIDAFFEDLDTLNIKRANQYPRATEHIEEMLSMIRTLRDKGFTYEKDGSIYFRIREFKEYGRLSGVRPEDVLSGARIDSDEYEKDDARDFVLWKAKKEGEHFWETEFGEGRPGWHLECSAMSIKYLGEQFDIHCGGEDNIFPHHENEIAQSEGCSGKKFVNYWLHCRHLLVDGEKMSKSKGNFFTLRSLLDKGFHPMAIRFFIISNHYRSPLNLTMDSLQAAHSAWSRIMDFRQRVKERIASNVEAPKQIDLQREMDACLTRFIEHMDDDLDTPRASSALFDFIRDANKIFDSEAVGSKQAQEALELLDRVDETFGVMKEDEALLDDEVDQLIQERQDARKNRNFARADEIRDLLAGKGIILEDTREGVRWKRR
ncbi:MAG: cysteine--tRNA ligase [bacterium]|nr:cysteine--tRNA ligase [bacterium]